ncbi:MAG TPA: YtxH domain-containing protein [Spirillospora sp.]|nr:YtxH domain-containing protein [Spirillospora sp.]
MKTATSKPEQLDGPALLIGTIMGLVIGGIAALFLSRRSGTETRRRISTASHELREQVEEMITPADPLEESMAEGKAAARRRRAELGLS